MEPFEDWLAHQMQGSGDLPEATFLALAGSEVVGYSKFSLTAAQPTTANHDMTGVKRAWRGRGIAGALKRAQIAWAKEQGYERLATQNEIRNEPIRRLNERLGYQEAPGVIIVRGPLAERRDARPLRRRQDALHDERPVDGPGDDGRDRDRLGHDACPATRSGASIIRARRRCGSRASCCARDGLGDDEIDPRLARWCAEASRRYLELLADADTSDWAAAEGAADAISQIEHRALLTGNPEPVARARMERIGLAELFPPGQGAFGCEAERPRRADRDRSSQGRRLAGRAHRRRRRHRERHRRSTSRRDPRHRLRRGPRRRRRGDRADERAAADARAAQRLALSARSIWRSASRFASSRRLSRCSLPRASASSSFARPFLK